MKPLFSVVLIAKNESKTLPQLIASLREFQSLDGEIILVDTGSADGTPELARSLGCKVFEEGERFIKTITTTQARQINHRFVVKPEEAVVKGGDSLFDYSEARNYAASLSSNNFVAMPDCDEEYTRFDLDAINDAISSGFGQLEYNFVYAHDEFGNEAVKFMHCKFYDRTKLHWVGIIHEVLSGSSVGKFVSEDKLKLEHWQNPTQNRGGYLTGLALDCFLNPDNDRNSHYFGRELMYKGRPRSAIKELTRHVGMKRWDQERSQSMCFIGDCHVMLGQTDEALDWYNRAFLSDGSRREPLMRLAEHFYRIGDRQKTAAYAAGALTIPYNPFYGNRMEHYTSQPHEMMYWSLWELNKEESRKHWREAIKHQPFNPKYLNASQFYLDPVLSLDAFKDFLGDNIKFAFVKIGDGEEQAMRGEKGHTCDGHNYSPALGKALRESYTQLAGQYHVIHYQDQNLVNLLLHRKPNDLQKLKSFWSSIRNTHRPKVFVGPKRLEQIAHLLKSEFIEVPEENAFDDLARIEKDLMQHINPNQIAMFSAGPAAKVLIAKCLSFPNSTTCLDCGSAFDPICGIESRTEQYSHAELLDLYSDWFEDMPGVSICIPTLGREEGLARLVYEIPRKACYPRFEIIVERDSFDNRQGVAKTLKRAIAKAKYDHIMFLGNDCLPQMGFLKHAVDDLKGNRLVGLNDGLWPNGELATHFLAPKSLLPLIGGELFHEGYNHVGCDNELTGRCRKLELYHWCKESRITHSPLNDDVKAIAWNPESVKSDRELLRQRAEQFGFDPFLK